MKISHTFATDKDLKISNNEYADFLIAMPIHTINGERNHLSGKEYQSLETFNSFSFAGHDYDLYLHSGRGCVGSDLNNYLTIPVPTAKDNKETSFEVV